MSRRRSSAVLPGAHEIVPGGFFRTCRICGAVFDRRRRDETGRVLGVNRDTTTCAKHRWIRRSENLVDKETPYERDVACQLFVQTFGSSATLDMIAEALGISRERVRQIELEALRKLREAGLSVFGLDPADPEEAGRVRVGARHDAVEEEDGEW